MSFATDFASEFSSFKVDPEPDKYLSNAFDPILLTRHNEAPRPEVENEDEEDIKTSGLRSLLSKRGLQYPSSIFDKHNFQL